MFLRRKKFIFSLIAFAILVLYQRIVPSEQVLSEQVQSALSPSPSPIVILRPQPKNLTKDASLLLSMTDDEKNSRQEAQVVRVVDGDTVEVLLDNKKEKVRVIGINTPEVVDPRKSVECFGKEASNMAKEILSNQNVVLESDSSQQNVDKYGSLLRYVFVNGVDFGKQMIAEGYAHEYTYDLPYKYQLEYKASERQARKDKVGLWESASCAKPSY